MEKSPVIAFLLLFFCLLFINEVTSKRLVRNAKAIKEPASKVAGGFFCDIDEVSYQAFIVTDREQEIQNCGGSILDEHNILTSASCLVGTNEVYVYIGQEKIMPDSEDQAYYSTSFFIHESFDRKTYDYNVGIIHIEQEMTLDGVNAKAVMLGEVNTPLPVSSPIRISGYGNISRDDGDDYYEDNVSRYLFCAEVPVMDQNDCIKAYQEYIEVTSRQFCAASFQGRGPCQGDFGGAAILIENGLQIGIDLASYGCGDETIPSLYTNATHPDILNFILKTIQN